ncbi:MAG: MFS transporter [Halolamina sp.]
MSQDDPSVPFVVGTLVAGVFFGGVGGGVAFPTLPTLGPLLGISPFLVGVVLSINRFTRLLANTPAGQVLDRFGTRRPMLVGFTVQGLVPFGYVLGLDPGAVGLALSSATVFLLARACWGLGSAFVFVGAFSTVTHVTTPANRGRWVAYMRGGQSLGFPTGLVVGGLVTDAAGYAVAFGAAGAAGLFAAAVAAVVLPDVSASAGETARLRDLPGIVAADRRIFGVGATNFAVRFLYAGVLLSTVVLYARENDVAFAMVSETGTSGLIMAVSVLALSLTNLAVGRFSPRLPSRTSLVLPGLAVFGGGFLLLGLVPTPLGTLAGVALAGVGVGAVGPPLMAYLGDIAPGDDVGKLGGVYNVFGDLGSTVGPVMAMPLAAAVPVTVEYLACAGVVAVTGGVVLVALGDVDAEIPTEAVPADD